MTLVSRLHRNAALALLTVLAVTSLSAETAKKKVLVASDGSGQFATVQEAVDSAPGGNIRIEIKPGTYKQVLKIAPNGIELRGLGKTPQEVILTFDNSAAAAGGTSKSASVTVSGDDFYAENLTIENNFEKVHPRTEQGSQAVALLVNGDRDAFRNVRLLGFQDTLYANSSACHNPGETGPCRASRQYFADCYIEGHVDFIFGDAKAVFDRCEIHALAHATVMLSAQSRLRPEEDSGYVFQHCTVTGDSGAKEVLLGRPWRAYSTVVWIDTDFKVKIDSKGWGEWDGRLATSDYAEFNSHGMVSDISQRVAPSKQLSAADAAKYSTRVWLAGKDGWNPETLH